MKTKNLLVSSLALLLTVSLVGCGGKGASSATTSEDTEGTSFERKTAKEKLQEALDKDYSNCTVDSASLYKQFEDDLDSDVMEYDSEIYYYKDYAIVYSELMHMNGYDNPYLYYHDYEGQNLLYFEKDDGGDAWLAESDAGVSYALKYTEFYLPAFLEGINVDYAEFYAGMYYITDVEEVARLEREVFCGIWENDIKDVVIMLDNEGYVSTIYGFEDLDNDTEYVKIQVGKIGTTTFDDSKLPAAPNEDNVMEFWQYKGWSGPTVNVFPTAISIDGLDDFEGMTSVTLDIEKTFPVASTLVWPELDSNRHNVKHEFVTWHSTNEKVAKCDYVKVGDQWVRTVKAVAQGECEIYAVAEGVNPNPNRSYDTYDQGVESNHIKVIVPGLSELDKTDAKYDIYFSDLANEADGTGTLTYANWVSGSAVNGTASTFHANLFNMNDLFYEGEDELKALILNPNNMQAEASATFHVEESVSKISFYYGMYYDHTAGISHVKSVRVETSTDGENWVATDATAEVKSNISYKNLKLLTLNLTAGTYVRIVVESDMVGSAFAFATSNVVLY